MPGARNPADIGTKVLPAGRLELLRALIGMGTPPKSDKGTDSSVAKIRKAAGAVYALVLSACIPSSDGVRTSLPEDTGSGDRVLFFSLVVWTIAGVFEVPCGLRSTCSQGA